MDTPTRAQLNGVRDRILKYDGNEFPVRCKLSEITWFTNWVETRDNYITVHEITSDTIQNAFAAGYTLNDIGGNSIIPRKLVSIVNVEGNYYLQGDNDIEKMFIYCLLYDSYRPKKAPRRVKDMFESQYIRNNALSLKMSKELMHKKNEQAEIITVVDNAILLKAKNIHVKLPRTFEFKVPGGIGVYRVKANIRDISDVWPNKTGRLIDVFTHVQVIDDGRIGIITHDPVEHITNGRWEETTEYEKGNRRDKTRHGLLETRRTVYRSCGERFVVGFPLMRCKNKPLGLTTSFWNTIHITKDPHMKEYVRKRRINPYEPEATEMPPRYGRIRYMEPNFQFRQEQEDALELIFDEENNLRDEENNLRSGIHILPCGAGKTLLGIATAVRSGCKRILVLVPNATIEKQWKRRFFERARVRANTLYDLGRISQDNLKKRRNIVSIISWDKIAWKCDTTLELIEGSRLEERKLLAVENAIFTNWDMVIIDEVHNIRTEQRLCLLSKLSYKSMVGLTATAGKSHTYPWYVEIAPILYETSWPLIGTHIRNVPCVPWGGDIYNKTFSEAVGNYTQSAMQTNQAVMKKTILDRMRYVLPTCVQKYEQMLHYNPIKLQKIKDIIEYHEQQNHPIIVFAENLEHMHLFRRFFVEDVPIHHTDRELFGNYFRQSYLDYLYTHIYNKYMDVFPMLGNNIDVWKNNLFNRWENMLNVWFNDETIDKMQRLCPNTAIDNMFCFTFVETMDSEKENLDNEIKNICKKNINEIDTLNPQEYAAMFFLFRTPRVVIYGNSDERNFEAQHRSVVFEKFKRGDIKTLFMSRIGNEGVDLPNARVIVIAGGQGSNETEDPQRFGRALRNVQERDDDPRYLYEVYTDTGKNDTYNNEKIFVQEREKFLVARGYNIITDTLYGTAQELPFGVIITTGQVEQYKQQDLEIDLGYGEIFIIHDRICVYLRVRRFFSDAYQIKCEYIAKRLEYPFIEIRGNRIYHKHKKVARRNMSKLKRRFPELVI